MNRGELEQLVSKAVTANPQIEAREIAARLKVDMTRASISYDRELRSVVEELKAIRISPVLASRGAVDQYSEYELWYDTWQESVHYTIVGTRGNEPQDKLVKWMLKFRARADQWLQGNTEMPQ